VQPVSTEAAPRRVCAHYGEPLPPPNGSATYVYGVGPVGYQHCDKCGANWRYLWHDQPALRVRLAGRRGRLFAVLGGVILASVVVVGVVALARSQPWNSASSADTSVPNTTPSEPVSSAVKAAYQRIAVRMSEGRSRFMGWVHDNALSTPEYLVDSEVNRYLFVARPEVDALDHGSWPDALSSRVDALISADRKFLDDVDLLHSAPFLYTPSFIDQLNQEAVAVKAADNEVRRVLVLPLVK
jgi:hypothetical protein